MIIGINYLVGSYDPLCLDFSDLNTISGILEKSFYKDLVPSLCSCNYEYCQASGTQTKYFYTLELIGEVDSTESIFRNWTKVSLFNSWSKLYSGKKNLSLRKNYLKHKIYI